MFISIIKMFLDNIKLIVNSNENSHTKTYNYLSHKTKINKFTILLKNIKYVYTSNLYTW